MFYINSTPKADGGYNVPQTTPADGLVILPDEFIDKYIELNGFVKLTIADGVVTAIRANNTARDAWLAKMEEAQAEQTPTETPDNDVVTWAELDEAYNEGRDAAYDE